jgi:hypothetical protein
VDFVHHTDNRIKLKINFISYLLLYFSKIKTALGTMASHGSPIGMLDNLILKCPVSLVFYLNMVYNINRY